MAAIEKATFVISADATVHLPVEAAEVVAMALKSSADTTVALTVTDFNSRTIATWESADYTTRVQRKIGPVETDIFDTAGDASANTEGQPFGIIADGPLTLDVTIDSGELAVEIFFYPVRKETLTLTTTNPDRTLGLEREVNVVKAIAVDAGSATATTLAVTDGKSQTVATFASADYSTRTLRHLAPVETAVRDAGNDPSADLEGNYIGVITEGDLTFDSTALDADFVVEVYFED